jgi:DNA invertase Pin-like site-specific DNA recombinase
MRVVVLDLSTSWMMATNAADEFTARIFEAINGMLLDMLAAVARKDCDDRRRRQAQGQAGAKAEGRYKGRPEDAERNDGIARMLAVGHSWGAIQRATAAAGRRSRRLPSGKNEPPKPLRVWMEQLGIGRASVYRALA